MNYKSQSLRFFTYRNGSTPYIGINGNWWIGTTDLGYSAQGTDGVSFEGIREYYYATKADAVNADGTPTPPEWDEETWKPSV
jgi:hypothetical protein